MSRMIDLVRKSAVSSNIMHAAARGALAVPPGEMVEIMVHLANHNRIFGQQARLTLAGWDEKASRSVAADPATPVEVLEYLISPQNLRMPLLATLLGNTSISEAMLVPLATQGSREVVDALRRSPRVQSLPALMAALRNNPNFLEQPNIALVPQEPAVEKSITTNETSAPAEQTSPSSNLVAEQAGDPHQAGEQLLISDEHVENFLAEHAAELASQPEKPFQPLGGLHGDDEEVSTAGPADAKSAAESLQTETIPIAPESAVSESPGARPAQHKPPCAKKPHPAEEEKRDSTLQKIAKLDVKGRIQLAMKGTKEERGLLIRDGTKLVALAVLDSPKITDGEVEKIATQKNVLEAVLRAIPMKRRYAKQYTIMRNLVFNPRTPLDVSLGLVKNLLVSDLKNLSGNKEVSDTIRKLGLRMFKQKLDSANKK